MYELEQLYVQLGLALMCAFFLGLLMWWVNRKVKGEDENDKWHWF